VDEIAIRLDESRRAEFRRFLVASGVLHLVLFGVLAWSLTIPVASPPAAITIDLTMAPPSAASKPGPAAKPKPKPPKKAPVILPTKPSTPKPQAKPKPEPPPAEEEPEQVEYDDLMAQLRADAGETEPSEQEEEPVRTASASGGGGPGIQVSPEMAAWMKAARIHVRRSWVVPSNFEILSLVVHVQIQLDASGAVVASPKVVRRSGNPYYDDGVISSIRKSSPLPAPPKAGTYTFIFQSDRDA
jgi:protein TonB